MDLREHYFNAVIRSGYCLPAATLFAVQFVLVLTRRPFAPLRRGHIEAPLRCPQRPVAPDSLSVLHNWIAPG